jgi:glutathione synthase/RimK-type ligase-like ATP-grasp enzyme
MKKKVIGYIFCDKSLGKDEKAFLKIAKKKNIDLVLLNTEEDLTEEEIEEKTKKCDIIFNNSAEEIAIELTKTLEELGKKVIEPSKVYYYIEDKWMFYLKCKEHKIPVPKTILLSESEKTIEKELIKFDNWPVILKTVEGTMGQFVEKADNSKQAVKIIKNFWKKANERTPVIAQEFAPSPSYRVTVINKNIVQTSIKESKGWKCTGVYEKKFKKFIPDKELKIIIKKLTNATGMKVFGLDLLKKNNHWLALEINAEPGLDFFEDEREKLIEKILDFLIKEIKK